MKAGLGDDAEDGWLLLGGQGQAEGAGNKLSIASGPGGSSALSYHEVASAAAAAYGGVAPGSGGGGGRGGGGRTPVHQLLR